MLELLHGFADTARQEIIEMKCVAWVNRVTHYSLTPLL
jgi:hypothetical protein